LDKEDKNQLKELERDLSKEEIAEELKNQQVELDTDIEETQYQIDNCHNNQQEDLEKQMMELYPSDEEEGAAIEKDEKNQENGCENKKMEGTEQIPEATGVNDSDVESVAMNEVVEEEGKDENMCGTVQSQKETMANNIKEEPTEMGRNL